MNAPSLKESLHAVCHVFAPWMITEQVVHQSIPRPLFHGGCKIINVIKSVCIVRTIRSQVWPTRTPVLLRETRFERPSSVVYLDVVMHVVPAWACCEAGLSC